MHSKTAELLHTGLPHNYVANFFYIDDLKQGWQKEAVL